MFRYTSNGDIFLKNGVRIRVTNGIRISELYEITSGRRRERMENVEFFNCLGSMRTNGSRWAREVKSRNGMAKSAAFSKKKILFTKRLDLNGRN
jgi:hypothetical protein